MRRVLGWSITRWRFAAVALLAAGAMVAILLNRGSGAKEVPGWDSRTFGVETHNRRSATPSRVEVSEMPNRALNGYASATEATLTSRFDAFMEPRVAPWPFPGSL